LAVPEILVKIIPEPFSLPIFGNYKKFPFSSRISGTRIMTTKNMRNSRREKERKKKRQTDRKKDRKKETGWTDGQMNRRIDKQTNRQTNKAFSKVLGFPEILLRTNFREHISRLEIREEN
jgi:hypothetical protein